MLDSFKTAVVILHPFCLSLREYGDYDCWMIGSKIMAEDRIVGDLGRQIKEADRSRSRNQRRKSDRGYRVRGAATFVPRIT